MTILDFYADWCNPCKSLAPVLDKVASERGIEVVKVNVDDDNEDLFTRHNVGEVPTVRNVPTVIVINDDGKEVARFVGTKSESDINKFFDDIK
jgi:thioredoxin 1